MQLSEFRTVESLVEDVRNIDRDIDRAATMLGVTLCGTYQNDDMVDRVRPVVLRVLQDRRHAMLLKLIEYGVYEDTPVPYAPTVRLEAIQQAVNSGATAGELSADDPCVDSIGGI